MKRKGGEIVVSVNKEDDHIDENVHENEVEVENFRMYPTSKEGEHNIKGEKAIESFHMYKSKKDDH